MKNIKVTIQKIEEITIEAETDININDLISDPASFIEDHLDDVVKVKPAKFLVNALNEIK